MTKKFSPTFCRITLAFMMILCCIFLSACNNGGFSKDDVPDIDLNDPDFNDEDMEDYTGGVNLSGVKVLRKPQSYNFDDNVSQDKDYGGQYYKKLANDILLVCYSVYGNFNTYQRETNILSALADNSDSEALQSLAERFSDERGDKKEFLYFYDAIRYSVVSESSTNENVVVTGSNNYAWNWSVQINNDDFLPWVYNYSSKSNTASFPKEGDITYNFETFKSYYDGGLDSEGYVFSDSDYQNAFVNDDYVDALTYAIYSIVLGMPIDQITVTNGNGSQNPRITIASHPAEGEKSSAAKAVEDIQKVFGRLGTYVGLTEDDKTKIVAFMLNNVIGQNARSYSFKNLYYNEIVDAIVRYCATLTTIASDSNGSGTTNLGGAFMASEVADFPYTTFFTTPDEDPFKYTEGAFEYQSMVFMPLVHLDAATGQLVADEIKITDLWFDLKYDADMDGDENFRENVFLPIEITVRWKKADGEPIKTLSQTVLVPDGPMDEGEDGHIAMFEFDVSESEGGFGEAVTIGMFDEPQSLKTTQSNRVVTLTGMTDARSYYKALKEKGNYNAYGVLDENKIKGSYLEVAFNVSKVPGDTTTNYAFYCAISNFLDEQQEDLEAEGFV